MSAMYFVDMLCSFTYSYSCSKMSKLNIRIFWRPLLANSYQAWRSWLLMMVAASSCLIISFSCVSGTVYQTVRSLLGTAAESLLYNYYPPFARRAKGEVFVLLHVCLFVRSTISQQPAGRFTPYFACGHSLGRDVSSPLLGVSDPRGGQKEGKWHGGGLIRA